MHLKLRVCVCPVCPLCRRLYSTAAAAGIEVPYEANLNNVGALVWLEQLMVGWVLFGRGGGGARGFQRAGGGGVWCLCKVGRCWDTQACASATECVSGTVGWVLTCWLRACDSRLLGRGLATCVI